MAGLLVIEHSPTLANLLQRTLTAGGFTSLAVVHDFEAAQGRLENASQSFDAVVLGVPQRGARAVKPILEALRGQAHGRTPSLLVVHHRYPQLERYADQRGHCAVMAWRQFGRMPRLLRGLLPGPDAGGGEEDDSVSRSVRVLFVDDSQSARHAYRQLLANHGFPVDVAATVAEAREKAHDGGYDLIIVDYYLPDGTGAELCAHLKSDGTTRDATLAVITGTYRERIIKECLEAGAVECMFKDEAKELFVARIHSIARSIESQASMEVERQRLDGILASVGDGVYGVDDLGVVTFINPTGLEILGQTSDTPVIGNPAQEVMHDEAHDQQVKALGECYLRGNRLSGFETVFKHRSGRPIPVECTVFPLSTRNRQQGSIVVFRDISERTSLEQLRWGATSRTSTSHRP